ncbi:MAG: amidase [Polyangiaceae bacterium]|nr:amidase [Polyangiaceae bacterium]
MAYKNDDPLTQTSATELLQMLARREVSAEEAARAHLDRIITIDGKVGAFIELRRGIALAEARRIDEARARGEDVGPLGGLPISMKENLDMQGHASTLGIFARRNKIAGRDATIVGAVRRAGAVVLGRTNVPQLLLSHETRNPVFGVTSNPFSKGHAPGGSSGGEAASLAAGMSVLGVGTDIGGSIRVPAHWTGIAGFKPSLDRWSNRGSNGALVGQETIRSQCGPMARSVRDLVMLFMAIDPRAMAAEDPLVAPLPLRDPRTIDARRIRVGYYVDDGVIRPSTAVGRAVVEAAKALEGRGMTVVPFGPPNIRDAIGTYFGVMSADGGKTAFGQLEGTTLEPTLAPLRQTAILPGPVRATLARTLRSVGQERAAWLLSQIGEKAVNELWRLTKAARDYRHSLLDAMDRAAIDVLLCPPHATPAVPHQKGSQFQLAGSYSMLYNLLQFPAGVVPVTLVRPQETSRKADSANAKGDRFEKIAQTVDAASAGLPVGVQIAGRPFCDEEVLAVMLALEEALDGRSDRPSVPRFPAS